MLRWQKRLGDNLRSKVLPWRQWLESGGGRPLTKRENLFGELRQQFAPSEQLCNAYQRQASTQKPKQNSRTPNNPNCRYLRVLPIKWHRTIQLRLEIHGCFKPYPVLALPSTTTESSLPCNNCPGVETKSLEMEACR